MVQETVFRKFLIKYIAESGADIKQTAKLIGVDSLTVAKWMNGEIEPHKLLQAPIISILDHAILDSANNKAS